MNYVFLLIIIRVYLVDLGFFVMGLDLRSHFYKKERVPFLKYLFIYIFPIQMQNYPLAAVFVIRPWLPWILFLFLFLYMCHNVLFLNSITENFHIYNWLVGGLIITKYVKLNQPITIFFS